MPGFFFLFASAQGGCTATANNMSVETAKAGGQGRFPGHGPSSSP